ncbi:MAG: class I SAM-dependent methyltransferase [Deltaproteobacteria bacterium]|nr:class I SAM-dependent methyltransferase [Deltaproteobacteria bacterium]
MGKFIYDKWARKYDNLMKHHRYFSTLKYFIKSLMLPLSHETPHILDLGCGTGVTTQVLKEKYPQSKITGFDYSHEMLKIYKKRNPEIQTITGNYNDESSFKIFPEGKIFRFESDHYDLVVSSTSISEYGIPQKIFPFVYRILKSGGLFLIIGIKDNLIGYLSGKVWHFSPLGERTMLQSFELSHFTQIQSLKIAWKLFPMNIMKYAVLSKKP